jgi:hypothetical protein
MKLHVLACNGHHQVSTVIKKSLYNLCEGVLMKRSLCINPLFALVSSVNCLYITNKEVFPVSGMEIGIFVLGLHISFLTKTHSANRCVKYNTAIPPNSNSANDTTHVHSETPIHSSRDAHRPRRQAQKYTENRNT